MPEVKRETKKQRRARQQQEAREEQATSEATEESAMLAREGDAGTSMAGKRLHLGFSTYLGGMNILDRGNLVSIDSLAPTSGAGDGWGMGGH